MPGEEAREVQALLKFRRELGGRNDDHRFRFRGRRRRRAPKWWNGFGSQDVKIEQLDTIFLIDGEAKLSGAVAVGRLLLAAGRRADDEAEVRAAGFGDPGRR